jgi:hypothetical protein
VHSRLNAVRPSSINSPTAVNFPLASIASRESKLSNPCEFGLCVENRLDALREKEAVFMFKKIGSI